MQISQALIIWTSVLCSIALGGSLSSTVASHPSLSILHQLLVQFDLVETFDDFSNITLIAPTDEAYIALAEWGFNVSEVEPFVARALLTYHVLDGVHPAGSIPARGPESALVVHSLLQPPVLANVTRGAAVKLYGDGDGGLAVESGLQVVGGVEQADVPFEGGILHLLNSSMVLPHNITATAQIGGLEEFLELMETVGSVEDLESLQDATLFVPDNMAIAGLKPLLGLLRPSQLAEVLGYHVVPGKVLYRDLLAMSNENFTTLQGAAVQVHSSGAGDIFVNNARLVRPDTMIYGGVLHIIDNLLVPESESSLGKPDLTGSRSQIRLGPV
ncbi:hypothetical protein MMC10_010274 [Thelotrema lepadinum]|nr:hypothetical protein [Thelotrema lepadinum]